MKPLDKIIEAARVNPGHIVLPEAEDPRVVEAAIRAVRERIAAITLLGRTSVVNQLLKEYGAPPNKFRIEYPASSVLTESYAAALHTLRKSKGLDEAGALKAVSSPLGFAAMMVRCGDADGTVGGAVNTTADTVRTALQMIGKMPEAELVSSFFLMMLCEPHHVKKGAFVFADCGLVVDPDAPQLADIALQSAQSYKKLTDIKPAVAMLSFSTIGSTPHDRVTKIVEATRIAREKNPDLAIEGELQFDTAFVEAISASKAPGSVLKGGANVFIFPNLEAANIGYKIAQRIGGAQAIGPILQGLMRPANDLSRGCTADDIFHMIAVTVVQSASKPVD